MLFARQSSRLSCRMTCKKIVLPCPRLSYRTSNCLTPFLIVLLSYRQSLRLPYLVLELSCLVYFSKTMCLIVLASYYIVLSSIVLPCSRVLPINMALPLHLSMFISFVSFQVVLNLLFINSTVYCALITRLF